MFNFPPTPPEILDRITNPRERRIIISTFDDPKQGIRIGDLLILDAGKTPNPDSLILCSNHQGLQLRRYCQARGMEYRGLPLALVRRIQAT